MKRTLTSLILALAAATHAQHVTLGWKASPAPGVVDYRVYFGTGTRDYSFVTNAGLSLTQTVVLPHTGRWFFAATAVDTNGVESAFSNEVEWEAKPAPPVMLGESWVRLTPVIDRSTNLVNWQSVLGETTWIPATNRQEFFATRRLLIEGVRRIKEP